MSDLRAALCARIGVVHHSDWLLVGQAMIDGFADVTHDHQYIHVDPVRAAQTPFGGTIAHGFLTLSLLSRLAQAAVQPALPDIRMGLNYGFDRIRFIHPVRSGSRIRAALTVTAVEEKRLGQLQQGCDVTVEIEGIDKPALTAAWLIHFLI